MTQDSSLATGERALAQHYQRQIKTLRSPLPESDALYQEFQDLESAFDAGFSDLLADRFEALAGQLTQRQDPMAYLMDTATGHGLHDQALARTREQEALVRQMSQDLQATPNEQAHQRLRQATALRTALEEHLHLWTGLAHAGSLTNTEDLTAPGKLLVQTLDSTSLSAPLPQEKQESPTTPRRLPRSIEVDRMLARQNTDAVSHYRSVDMGELITTAPPETVDPAVHEILRSRVQRAPTSDPQAEATLAQLDAQMAQAAQAFGASYVQATAAPALAMAPTMDLSALAKLRTDLVQQRLASTTLQAEDRAALESQRDTLLAQTQTLSEQPGDATQAEAFIRAAQEDLQQTQNEAASLKIARQALAQALAQTQALQSTPEAAPLPGLSPEQARQALENSARSFEAASAQNPEAQVSPSDLNEAVSRGAAKQQKQAQSMLARRLMQRRSTRPLTMPSLGGTRVFASDKGAMDPLYVGGQSKRVPMPGEAGQAGGGMFNQVQGRLARHGQVPTQNAVPADNGRLALLGKSMARAIHKAAAKRSASPSPVPVGAPAPRMSSTPSDIFADTSSATMQNVYMPVLARMSQVGRASMPRAQRRAETTMARDLANPEALFSILLGEYGERLRKEKPKIAERLEASLKEVAQALPQGGSSGLTVVQKYSEQFRRNVESWLGGGQDNGPNQEKHEHILTPEAESTRAVGEVMGGFFAQDTVDQNSKPPNMSEIHGEDVERRLRLEKTTIDHALVEKVSKIIGKKPGRQMEAFRGPMAEQIAKEMGAKAFSVRNQMFLPSGADESLVAHEMVHAIEDNPSADPSQIQKEEMVAYGVQQDFEKGRENVERTLKKAADRMELAKDTNRKPMKLSTEPGGVTGASDPDPAGLEQDTNVNRYEKERQIIENLADYVEDLVHQEETVYRERYGDY